MGGRGRRESCVNTEKGRCRVVRISAQFVEIQHPRGCRIGCGIRCSRKRTAAGKNKRHCQKDEWPDQQLSTKTHDSFSLCLITRFCWVGFATRLVKSLMSDRPEERAPDRTTLSNVNSIFRHRQSLSGPWIWVI